MDALNNERKALKIENAKIIFRNFSGTEGTYNRAGDRNFCVIIDDADMAQTLIEDGWNVKPLKNSDEFHPKYYMKVIVKYNQEGNKNQNQPNVNMVDSKQNVTKLTEETVSVLDSADIDYVDLIINPYFWDVNGKKGISAYLKTMYAVLEEDELAAKHEHPRDDDEDNELPFK